MCLPVLSMNEITQNVLHLVITERLRLTDESNRLAWQLQPLIDCQTDRPLRANCGILTVRAMSRTPLRIVSLLAISLIAGNMHCLSACSVHPCDESATESRPVGEGATPTCHHQSDPTPGPDRSHTQPCSHQPLLAKSGSEIKAPVFSISNFPLVAVGLEIVAVPAESPFAALFERAPAPVWPGAVSHWVLRI